MRISSLLLRRVHEWIGLIIGLQFVIWTGSGAMMALLDTETVAGGPRPARAAMPQMPASGAGWQRVRQTIGAVPVTGVSVRPLLDRQVMEVRSGEGVRIFDAATGAPIAVDAAVARRVAEANYVGAGPVRRVSSLNEISLAVREHALPIWRVDFADEQNSSFYVSGATGALLERRNDTWRTWDFFWMLHNMDYVNRTSFNHPLIVGLAFGIIWLAITGFWLLFRTAWKPDLRLLRRRV